MKSVVIIILFGIIALLIITNPKEEDHKSEAKKAFINKLKKQADSPEGNVFAGLGLIFTPYLIDPIIESSISRKNYIFFSLTVFDWEGESKIIGIGTLGSVFIPPLENSRPAKEYKRAGSDTTAIKSLHTNADSEKSREKNIIKKKSFAEEFDEYVDNLDKNETDPEMLQLKKLFKEGYESRRHKNKGGISSSDKKHKEKNIDTLKKEEVKSKKLTIDIEDKPIYRYSGQQYVNGLNESETRELTIEEREQIEKREPCSR